MRYNKNTCESFSTNIGCPQGDALSPVLFTVYLEACMKEIKTTYPENSYELIYADDANFVSPSDIKLDEIKAIFRKWGLTLNKSKTEERLLNEENTVWKTMKILGSYVGTCEDIKKTKTLATLTMNRLNLIWKSGISVEKKIRIYKAYVLSIFLYGCSAWADFKSIRSSIDSFQRKHMKTEKSALAKCYEKRRMRLRHTTAAPGVRLRRLKMLGHICRNDPPAKNILEKALKNSKRKRGRPPSTLLNTIINDMNSLKLNMDNIEKIDKDAYRGIIRTHCSL